MEKLFYTDIHTTDFEASVTECTFDAPSGIYKALLDRTAFFPEEGGQLADKGTLNGLPVQNVQIKNDLIYHYIPEPLPVGRTVSGHVDWDRRFDFMQQHSGEHIISGLVHRHFGYDNVGFHLGLTDVTLDFNGALSMEQLHAVEAEANKAVWTNLPILISFPEKHALEQMRYRSKIELAGAVRIVEIPGIDTCACCAPHTDTTGQIGLIKITNVQSHRGGVRVNILCGGRAVADYTEKQSGVFAVSALLSAKQNEIAGAVTRLQEENAKRKERCNELQSELLQLQMRALPAPFEAENNVLFTGSLDHIAMRNAVNSLTEKYKGYCCIFAQDNEEDYRFIIGSSSKDCRSVTDALRRTLQAKGGGTAPMVQGSVSAPRDSIEACLQQVF